MSTVLLDPHPRKKEDIFTTVALQELSAVHQLIEFDGSNRADFYNKHIGDVDFIIGHADLDAPLLKRAQKLKAVFNVEGNFMPNIDYQFCFSKGIRVLTPSSVFSMPVAEIAIGMLLSLARGIHSAHGDFVKGKELYGLAGNAESELISGAELGFIGFGDLGKAIHKLLQGFRPTIRVFDPWLTESFFLSEGVVPARLEEVLAKSRFIFVVAAVTETNSGMLNAEKLDLMQHGAGLLLLNRAAIADFDALAEYTAQGKIRLATDVFPEEPLALDHPIRKSPNVLLSAHRAGALSSALLEMGDLVLEDLKLMEQGLPPQNCKRAEPETVASLRSKPVEKS
ncbi:MAG: dehydrogenase [SAR324 cluster bacterium]|nr:dehydrogenase [SAR324 cluster bacterium]MBL7036199.1 dehydrogenase [SAR324 cluster bacterium]